MVYTPVFDISPTKFRWFTHRAFRITPPEQAVNKGCPQRNTLFNTRYLTHTSARPCLVDKSSGGGVRAGALERKPLRDHRDASRGRHQPRSRFVRTGRVDFAFRAKAVSTIPTKPSEPTARKARGMQEREWHSARCSFPESMRNSIRRTHRMACTVPLGNDDERAFENRFVCERHECGLRHGLSPHRRCFLCSGGHSQSISLEIHNCTRLTNSQCDF